jgi:hypothetical protein
MRLPVAARSELDTIRSERDEWRKRAESAPTPSAEYVVLRRSGWAKVVSASWLLVLGLLVGGVAVPRASDAPTLTSDYPGCIGKARYESPIAGNQYQELVNALYACGVYEAP